MLDGSSLVLVLVLGVVAGQGKYPATLGLQDPFKGPDQGNWTVQNCLIARMAAQVQIYPIPQNSTSLTVVIPTNALASGDCHPPDNSTQILTLAWAETQASNRSILLNRNVTITFSKNVTNNTYGVLRMEMVYETRKYNKKVKNVDVWTTEYVSMMTERFSTTKFPTPINRSYLCSDVATIILLARLHDTSTPTSHSGIKLKNTTLTATKVQLDAFRAKEARHNQFQIAQDCAFHSNDGFGLQASSPMTAPCSGFVLLVLIAGLVI